MWSRWCNGVGPALQQRRGQRDRHRRHRQRRVDAGDGKAGRRLAHQHRDGVFILAARQAGIERRGAGAAQRAFGLDHVGLARNTGRVAILGEAQRALVGGDGRIEKELLAIRGAQLEVILGQGRVGRQAGGGEVGIAGLDAQIGGFHVAGDASPHVQLPTGRGAEI